MASAACSSGNQPLGCLKWLLLLVLGCQHPEITHPLGGWSFAGCCIRNSNHLACQLPQPVYSLYSAENQYPGEDYSNRVALCGPVAYQESGHWSRQEQPHGGGGGGGGFAAVVVAEGNVLQRLFSWVLLGGNVQVTVGAMRERELFKGAACCLDEGRVLT